MFRIKQNVYIYIILYSDNMQSIWGFYHSWGIKLRADQNYDPILFDLGSGWILADPILPGFSAKNDTEPDLKC